MPPEDAQVLRQSLERALKQQVTQLEVSLPVLPVFFLQSSQLPCDTLDMQYASV